MSKSLSRSIAVDLCPTTAVLPRLLHRVTSQNAPQELVSKKCDLAVSNRSGVTSIDCSFVCTAEEAVQGRYSFSEFIAFNGCMRLSLTISSKSDGQTHFFLSGRRARFISSGMLLRPSLGLRPCISRRPQRRAQRFRYRP